MFLLTAAGLLLFLPPIAYIFNHRIALFGVPQIVVYLFGVWFALIGGTAALTARLEPDSAGDDS
ncbi:hypothetical protein [Devosia rhizoryzae]|uniref:DUF3311 domain-containing protein n=1 Tax=Devosia rhizoryzae TaxID=2774137 RepID=A0ABX7C8T6_9HYPH|nr:hypothetical protein [Devosia rhizoryzae]QQR40665.1 hypothetical protein JI748_06620 [Devosia rhizoryzae]